MNKKSILNRMQLPIDLTALLDVVFIVLLIVICNQQQLTSSREAEAESSRIIAEAELAEADAKLADAQVMQALYAEHLNTAENLGEYVSILTVFADYTPGSPKERTIRILDTEGELYNAAITPESGDTSYKALRDELTAKIEAAEDRPVILSVNLDRILYRDEEAISGILSDLQKDHDNVYIK